MASRPTSVGTLLAVATSVCQNSEHNIYIQEKVAVPVDEYTTLFMSSIVCAPGTRVVYSQ